MKTLFVEVRSKVEIILSEEQMDQLPQNICIAASIQFLDNIEPVKKQLEEKGKTIILFTGTHTAHPGQLLGCNVYTEEDFNADAFLYLGDGTFHPRALAFKRKRPIFTYNPFSQQLEVLDLEEIEKVNKQIEINRRKFYASDKIGVIVTSKPGQNSITKAETFKNKFKDKRVFMFFANTIEYQQLNNFPFIDCWVNTACPRIGMEDSLHLDKPLINIEDIEWKNKKE